MLNLGTLVATLGVNTAGLAMAEREMRAFETRTQASLNRINATLKTTGATMKSVGRGMTMGLTLPMALVGGAAFKMHKDFEANMSKITGLVGVARDQTAAWTEDILDMAPAVAKGPKELSDALYFITSAGIRGAEAMDVLEMSAKAATAGLGETKTVADLVTSAMNAYGPEVLNAKQATEALVATVREGKAAPEELAQSMGMVLPLASEMEVAFEEVGAATAAMTRTGTNAATASMQLRQILASLLKPTQQAEGALIHMKTSSAELRKTIREEGLLKAMMDIRKLTNEYGEDMMAKVFPNIRALSGVLDMMGKNAEENAKIFEALQDNTGDLEKALAAATDTAEFKFNQSIVKMQTSLTRVGDTVAEVILPVFRKMGDIMEDVSYWFDSLSNFQKRLVVTVGLLVAAIGPLLTVLGMLVGTLLPKLISLGWGAVKMFNALRLAMLKNPFTALTVVVLAAAAAIYQYTRSMRRASDTQKMLNELNVEAKRAVADERVELEKLLRIAKSEHVSKEQRADAIKRINKLSPEYLGNITAENINTKKTTESINQYIKALASKAKVQAAQEQLVELEKERIRTIAEGTDKQVTLIDKIKSGYTVAGAIIDVFGKRESTLNKEREIGAEKALEAEQAYTKAKEFLLNIFEEETKKQGEFQKQTEDAAGSVGTVNSALQSALHTLTEMKVGAEESSETYQKEWLDAIETVDTGLKSIDLALDIDLPPQLKAGKIIKEAREELAKAERNAITFGESFDLVAEKSDIIASAMQRLQDVGGPFTPAQLEWIEEYITKMDTFEDTTKSVLTVVGEELSNTANAFSALGNAIAHASEDGKITFAEGMNIISQTALTTISVLGALAAANIIAKESIKGLVGIITVVAGLATLAAVWATFVKPTKYETPMAEGGEIPEGFENDTFHARLSSKEAVIPLNKFWNQLENAISKKDIFGGERKIIFKIEGRMLEGILHEQREYDDKF